MEQRTNDVTPEIENAFATRSKAVFDGLGVATVGSSSWAVTTSQAPNKRHAETSEGSEVPFKKPLTSSTTAKFKRNADQWTSYDLSDVGSDQLSGGSNTRAAFDFLQSRTNRDRDASNESEMPDAEQQETKQRHIFHSKKTATQPNSTCESMDTDSTSHPSQPAEQASKSGGGVSLHLPDVDSANDAENEDQSSSATQQSSFKKRSKRGHYKKHASDDEPDEDNENLSSAKDIANEKEHEKSVDSEDDVVEQIHSDSESEQQIDGGDTNEDGDLDERRDVFDSNL